MQNVPDFMHEKRCPKEVWQEIREMTRWNEKEQKDIDQESKEVCYAVEEQVLDAYEVEQGNRKACGGQGEPLQWEVKKRWNERRRLRLVEKGARNRCIIFWRSSLSKDRHTRSKIWGRGEKRRGWRRCRASSKRIERQGRIGPAKRWCADEASAKYCESEWMDNTWDEFLNNWEDCLSEEWKNKRSREVRRETHHQWRSRSRFVADQVTKPTLWRGGTQILEEVYGDADPLKRVKERVQEWREALAERHRGAERGRQAVEENMQEKQEVLPPMRLEEFRHAARINKSTTAEGFTQSLRWMSLEQGCGMIIDTLGSVEQCGFCFFF